jgi:5'-3' exonuclease
MSYKGNRGKILIDGDIVSYRAAFYTQDKTPVDAEYRTDEIMSYILDQTLLFPDPSDYQVFLTGKNNFRFDIAKAAPYKGNRSNKPKPIHLEYVRGYLMSEYDAVMSDGQEADDLIAIAAADLDYNCTIASVDKDFMQVPCWHFNFVKSVNNDFAKSDDDKKEPWVKVDYFEGIKFFYKQILMGDSVDNIIGLYKVGPVKADKILDGIDTEVGLWDAVVKAYDGNEERVLENARLLWLQRYHGEVWQPPKE